MIALALLASRSRARATADDAEAAAARSASAARLGNRLFGPALAIPALVLVLVLGGKHLSIGGTALIHPPSSH